MASKKPIDQMDDDTLMSEWTALGAKVEEDRARLREFSQEHQKRERLRQLNISPADLALLQSVSPDAIKSEERVNG